LDEVIKLIRNSDTPEDARVGLMEQFGLSDLQARAILDMTLRRLTGLERDKIKEEYAELMKTIDYLKSVLADEELRMKIIKDELIEIKEKFGDERRSQIVHSAEDMRMEDFIDDEEIVITISHNSYVKRTPLSEYKRQGRGGRGSIGTNTREEDFTEHIITAQRTTICCYLRKLAVASGYVHLKSLKEAVPHAEGHFKTSSMFQKKKK